MVVIEELDEIDDARVASGGSGVEADSEAANVAAADNREVKKKEGMKRGFLNDESREAIYGPEGSSQGHVSEKQKQEWTKHEMDKDINKKTGFGAYNSDHDKPHWFTSEWPSNCQYNNPSCDLRPLVTSKHESDLHQRIVQENDRWKKVIEQHADLEEYCLSFVGVKDDDVRILLEKTGRSTSVRHVDLTFNHVQDAGLQLLAGKLGMNSWPKLERIRLYKNEWTGKGEEVIRGLRFLRPKLMIEMDEPEYFKSKKTAAADEVNVVGDVQIGG